MEKEKITPPQKPAPGMIHVYTGDGKGKTTAALGLALRASGHGLKVFIIQFMKNPEMMGDLYGEIQALRKYLPEIEIHSFGRAGWVRPGEATEEDKKLAKKAIALARKVIKDTKHQLVVLDEIFLPLHFQIITLKDILDLIDLKPPKKELVLTGRKAPPKVIARADLVTEMRSIKHYFDKGLAARKGVEY